MCFVSAISTSLPSQRTPFHNLRDWPAQQVLDLAEVIRRLDRIAAALGLKDCKDDEKENFLAELAALVQKFQQRDSDRQHVAAQQKTNSKF